MENILFDDSILKRKTQKILIVDDEIHIRMLLEQALEDLEYYDVEIILAGDGEEALEEFEDYQPELIFLDVMMPKIDGFSVCRKIRAKAGQKPHIIMLTERGQDADIKQGIDAGANEYLTKPFDPAMILQKAQTILNVRLDYSK
jgi:two-component system alkaline phosphatase synthesis response regulator PhoP